MNNIKIFNLLSTIFITCLISSCFDSSVKFSIKNAFKQNLSSLEVQNINFNNNQITVHGNNLNNVSSVTIKDNGQITNLNIVSKTENKIILQAAQSLAINAQKILELVFSNANASSSVIQQIEFSMCDSTINNVQFDCSITPNEKEVLSYDAIKGWTPRAMNGLSYKGAWSAITPLPDPDAFTNGDYFLVSVANPPYQVGDWIVVNEGSFDQIDNSSAIINVFGRTGAITAQKGDYNLNHLGDVLITSPATNQVLMFNGTNWVNRNLPVSGGGGGSPTPAIDSTTDLAEGTNLYFTQNRVLTTPIGSLTLTNSTLSSTDTIKESLQKLQGQINNKEDAFSTSGTSSQYLRGDKTLSSFETDVKATSMTSVTTTSSAVITGSDSISQSIDKIHTALVSLKNTALTSLGGTLTAGTISGVPAPIYNTDVANKKYVDDSVAAVATVEKWTDSTNSDIYSNAAGVGIGVQHPNARLEVSGDIVSQAFDNTGNTSFDFNNANIQYTTNSCSSYALYNLKNGGAYQIVIQGTTSAQCNFTSPGLTLRFFPDNAPTITGKHTIYSMTRVGSYLYISWFSGI